MGLELYAKIEPYLGFEEQKHLLYDIFLQKLKSLNIKTCLDVGCGSGEFLLMAKEQGLSCMGIDLSYEMIQRAKVLGVEVYNIDLCQITKKFDAVTAIFDVINYLKRNDLEKFFQCVYNVLNENGYFVCDMNTLYGFKEVAQGALILDKNEHFITIDAEFNDNKLTTMINYFFAKGKNCYQKEHDVIIQYYHDIELLKNFGLKLVDLDFIALYGEQADKVIMTWKRM